MSKSTKLRSSTQMFTCKGGRRTLQAKVPLFRTLSKCNGCDKKIDKSIDIFMYANLNCQQPEIYKEFYYQLLYYEHISLTTVSAVRACTHACVRVVAHRTIKISRTSNSPSLNPRTYYRRVRHYWRRIGDNDTSSLRR